MSATLPNLDLLAKWLNAALFKTDFRPIPLEEQLKIDTVIYDKNLKPLRTVQPEIVIQVLSHFSLLIIDCQLK